MLAWLQERPNFAHLSFLDSLDHYWGDIKANGDHSTTGSSTHMTFLCLGHVGFYIWPNSFWVWAREDTCCLPWTRYSVWGWPNVETEAHVKHSRDRAIVLWPSAGLMWSIWWLCSVKSLWNYFLPVLHILWPCILEFVSIGMPFQSPLVCHLPISSWNRPRGELRSAFKGETSWVPLLTWLYLGH